jgi:hypothetical protein
MSKLCVEAGEGDRKEPPKILVRYLSRLIPTACQLAELSEEGRIFAAFRQKRWKSKLNA